MAGRAAMAAGDVSALLADLRAPRPPLLLVLSGPSGVGKDAVLAELAGMHPHLARLVTCTTRPRRPGEAPGVDYHFVSRAVFLEMRERGDFLETAEVLGDLYGTPRLALREAIAAGRDVILKIDTRGAEQVRQAVPEAVLVFLAPPSLESLAGRLRRRQSYSAEQLAERLDRARAELAVVGRYDYAVVNREGHPEEAAAIIRSIVVAEKRRVGRREPSV